MRDSRGLLILLAVVVVVAGGVWLWTRPRPELVQPRPEREAPIRFLHGEVPVESPDLEVGPAAVRGSIRSSYTSWTVSLTCAEPGGCTGEFAVEVRYHTGEDDRRLVLVNRSDVPSGGVLRFEGLQDPSTPVDRIEGLTLEVRSRGTTGETVEIPL